MKKLFVFSLLLATVIVFSYCSSTKKTTSTSSTTVAEVPKEPVKVTSLYAGNVETVLLSKCSPCHFPPGGNKLPLNTFASVKANIDEIIKRIELNPMDRGFMPFKKPAKLDSATINIFKQWKADGMIEK
jgi:ABC-type Fe3+-hydroxamate transport system substrate-binding protein